MQQQTEKEKILAYKVLDKGFVELLGFMGGDICAINSARVSFAAKAKNEACDKRLIAELLKNGHLSPFEHSVFQFHIKCPIFVARQWLRHRIASYNEVSARYVEVKDEFYMPKQFRYQLPKESGNKKAKAQTEAAKAQAEAAKAQTEAQSNSIYAASIAASYAAYKKLLSLGIAKELARALLPLSQYTRFYWTINARSLINYIKLRSDGHAQYEIRCYAKVIKEIFRIKMPWTASALDAIEKEAR